MTGAVVALVLAGGGLGVTPLVLSQDFPRAVVAHPVGDEALDFIPGR